TGKEGISEAYDFEVVATADDGADIEQAALGRRAELIFNIGPEPRAFYGVIAAVRLVTAHQVDRKIKYALRVVPRLWLLRRKRRSRIFQQMRVPDIVTAVLAEAGIVTRWQLTHAYPTREYCTQYEETDYRFLQRILAEAGIYFYFFSGGPVSDAAFGADAAVTLASGLVGEIAGPAMGSLVGSLAQMAEALIPGDSIVCADDAVCYPPVAGDDAASLAASTAAALAPAVIDVVGLGTSASAVAGAVIAAASESAHDVPALSFFQNEEARVSQYDKITRFALRNTVRSSAATFRDYDPMRPMVRLNSTAVSTQPFPPSPMEAAAMAAAAVENAASTVVGSVPVPAAVAEGLGAATAVANKASAVADKLGGALGQRVPLEVYDHHAPFLVPKWGFAADEAPRMLRQKRRRASIARGESGCADFSPGHRFSLNDHPAPQLDGVYALTRVEHHGQAHPDPGRGDGELRVYYCTFECLPADMTYPPRRPKRDGVQVALTATVVGPSGSDIHVDAIGQIKVQFHWDREGKYDDNSSCWMRVMQPWAGAGWGHQFIPRVGQEVVVVFEGGDPDKPMILGSLYNGTHPPPFNLPAEKTRSGIRTQTSPGGSGFNELSFEDAAGKEQIFVHAQANLDEVVGRNHTLSVQNDELIKILGSRLDTIEKNLKEHVKGDHTSNVDGHRFEVVSGNHESRVTGMRVARVEGRERLMVEKAADLEYADELTTRVKGSMTTVVGKDDKKRSWTTHAHGSATLSGLDKLELASDKEIVLRVGKSAIRITPDKIEALAAGLSAKGKGGSLSVGDDGILLESKDKARLSLDKKMLLKTEGASLSMEKEVKVDGSKILLNSPDKASDPPAKDPEPPTTLTLTDKDAGTPLAQQRYLIKLDGGAEISGMTDEKGKAELSLPSGGTVTFPDLKMPGDLSNGPLEPYVIRQGDYVEKLAFAHGFDAEKIWDDPKNADLKKKRKDPNQLLPGDILYFAKAVRDGETLKKATDNKYKAQVPKTKVTFTFKDAKGPFAGEAYFIEGLGAKVEGKADGAGVVIIEAPVHVREAKIVFTAKGLAFPLSIGDMDPIDEPSGV
ncbi:MAG: type VI secretion system tip protein TssI/VgrG, partial [Minicystis sp.]